MQKFLLVREQGTQGVVSLRRPHSVVWLYSSVGRGTGRLGELARGEIAGCFEARESAGAKIAGTFQEWNIFFWEKVPRENQAETRQVACGTEDA